MAIPSKIWDAFIFEWQDMRGEYEFDKKANRYVSKWDNVRIGKVRAMMVVAGAWAANPGFTSEQDLAAKVIRYCSTEFKQRDGKKDDLKECIPSKSEMISAYAELRDRWPEEFSGGFDPQMKGIES